MSHIPKPTIIWKPAHSSNYAPGRNLPDGRPVLWEALCFHTTAGGSTIEALDSHFRTPGVGASTPFGIGYSSVNKRYEIHQYVSIKPDIATAFAQGRLQAPSARLVFENGWTDELGYASPGFVSPNAWCIGIELLDGGKPGNHKPQQIELAIQLGAWLFQDHVLPTAAATGAAVDRDHVLGHFEFDSVDRAFCPGWSEARFTRVINGIKTLLAAPPVVAAVGQPVGSHG